MVILLPGYLLVILLWLPGGQQRSLKADRFRRNIINKTKEEAVVKSFPFLKSLDNFVDGECPPTSRSLQDDNLECRHECNTDADCAEDYRCCQSGCSMMCVEPWFPNRVVDCAKSSSNQTPDASRLPNAINEPRKSRGEPCSTSVLDGLPPLRCPTNHVCRITTDEDVQLQIPNRGECVRIREQQPEREMVDDQKNPVFSASDKAVCSHNGDTYRHKEKFRKDCNICVCHNGVVFCDNQPCPVKRGIPASISRDEEIRRRSHERYISIDDEEVTEDASGSIDFGSGVEVYKERQNEGDTGLGKKDGGRENGSRGDDDKREQEFDDFSEDGNQKHLREINGQDNGDDDNDNDDEDANNSGDEDQASHRKITNKDTIDTTVIKLESHDPYDDDDYSGESGSTPLETERKEGTSNPKNESYNRTSTLALPTITLKNEISTNAVPTENVIRLEGGDYEESGGSGDDDLSESGTSGVSGSAYSSGEDTQHPENFYPRKIVLKKNVDVGSRYGEFGFIKEAAVNNGAANLKEET